MVFVHSQVEHISDAVKEKVDTVFFCNAIHYVPDKGELLDRIAGTIKPGGKLVFNTSFYSGPLDEETQLFYRKWMFKAQRILRREHGLSIQRIDKVESRKQLTAEEYKELVEGHGFRIEKQEVDPVKVPLQGWLDISSFSDFIEGAMPGVPPRQGEHGAEEGGAGDVRGDEDLLHHPQLARHSRRSHLNRALPGRG